jgi:hypothetical protein
VYAGSTPSCAAPSAAAHTTSKLRCAKEAHSLVATRSLKRPCTTTHDRRFLPWNTSCPSGWSDPLRYTAILPLNSGPSNSCALPLLTVTCDDA